MTIQDKFLWHIAMQGMYEKYGSDIPLDKMDRLNMEMEVITKNKFTDYILMIWDIHNFCKTPLRVNIFCALNGIIPPPDGIVPLGPGRGSVGGSLVCYVIDIHECDPIKFGLYFERFLNPERIAYPDIDYDISQKYRHIVLAYIAYTYGEAHVAQIITYSTLSVRTLINDVLSAACVPLSTIQAIKDIVPEDPEIRMKHMINNPRFVEAMRGIAYPDIKLQITQQNATKILNAGRLTPANEMIVQSVVDNRIISADIIIESTWTYDKAIHTMERLEGLNKHESTHAAGVVVAPVVLDRNVPLTQKDGEGVLVCQYDMTSLEELGYLKMDALGLRTVDVNHSAEAMVKKWYDPDFNIRKVPYMDTEAMELIRNGDTIGIFQIESNGFSQMMQDIDIGGYEVPRHGGRTDISDFMWITAGVAMYRPGPLDAIIDSKTMVQHIIDRKHGREPVRYLFPEEEAYLEETYGVMVYQEQVMMRVRQMTGCTLGRADILRKAMGKKDPILMKAQMDWFESTAMVHEFTNSKIDKQNIVHRAKDEIDKFARYGFNKAHAVEYAHICYRNAYFKAHYPVPFYTALLNSEVGNSKRQTIIIRDMMKHGINLLPPLVSKSDIDFTMTDPDTIRFGLAAIKGLGKNGLGVIMEEKALRGEFKSIEDFRIRVPATLCNVTVITNLAKCGAFDDVLDNSILKMHNRATLVASTKDICDAISKAKGKKGKNKMAPSVDEVLKKFLSGAITYGITTDEDDPIQYATWEKEVLNYYISAHPIDAYRDEINRWQAIDTDMEVEDMQPEFYIAGFIGGCHETVIKKEGRNKGKTMGFVTIEGEFRAYEATLFPGVYESCLPYMKVGSPVVLKGKKSFYKDKASIQGVYIRHMMNNGIRDCPECHIRIETPLDVASLIQLRQMFDEHPGLTQVYIHIRSGHYDFTMLSGITISLNDRIIDFCTNVGKLSYKPI